MAIEPTLIRNVTVDINTGTTETPTWTNIKGLTQLQHQPATTRADRTTFDLAGYTSQLVVSRGDSFTAQILIYEDETTGDRDPGQEALEAAGQLSGQAGITEFQITRAGGGIIEVRADVETSLFGGGVNDLSSGSVTLTVQEIPTFIPAP